MPFDPKDVERNKVVALLSYLWILFLVPLLWARKSQFAQAHAKQGLVLFIVQAISSLIAWIPVVGWLWSLFVFFILPIYVMTRVLLGQYWRIPILAKYAEQISFD